MRKVLDVVLFDHGGFCDVSDDLWNRFPIVDKKIDLVNGLWIGPIDTDLSEKIMDSCEPKGLNCRFTRQFSTLYAICNDNPNLPDNSNWDSDSMIQSCLLISRIIHPTSFGFRYSARLSFDNNGIINEIIPGFVSGFGNRIFLADTSRDWLTEYDCNQIIEIFPQFLTKRNITPISKSLWYYEYAHRLCELDVRWTLICTGLEIFLCAHSENQFKIRFPKLATELGIDGISDDDAKKIYKMRSKLVHGQKIGDDLFQGATRDLYVKMESVLRESIKKALTDESFSQFISDPKNIRVRWPT